MVIADLEDMKVVSVWCKARSRWSCHRITQPLGRRLLNLSSTAFGCLQHLPGETMVADIRAKALRSLVSDKKENFRDLLENATAKVVQLTQLVWKMSGHGRVVVLDCAPNVRRSSVGSHQVGREKRRRALFWAHDRRPEEDCGRMSMKRKG